MRILFFAAIVIVAANSASAQSLQECYNGIGTFTTPSPDPATWWTETCYPIDSGLFDIHVVVLNAWNEATQSVPSSIGGYQFRLDWPHGWLVTPHLPPGSWNETVYPDIDVRCDPVPVVASQCVLLRLEIGFFAPDPVEIYVRPLAQAELALIPGEIAILDGADLTPSRATPVSYDYDVPVWGIYDCDASAGPSVLADGGGCWSAPVDRDQRTWSDVKAMFR